MFFSSKFRVFGVTFAGIAENSQKSLLSEAATGEISSLSEARMLLLRVVIFQKSERERDRER